jgi:hypothetical protein
MFLGEEEPFESTIGIAGRLDTIHDITGTKSFLQLSEAERRTYVQLRNKILGSFTNIYILIQDSTKVNDGARYRTVVTQLN